MVAHYFGTTDPGRLRDNNEDAFICTTLFQDRYVLACVIDGVGGYEGGEVAAQTTREAILHYFSVPSGEPLVMMREAISLANERIYREKLQNPANEQMACVLTVAVADTQLNKVYYAHVGDTRLYLFRDGSLVKLTRDHSFIGFLEDNGRLSEEAAMNHPKRNEINKALGFDPHLPSTPEYIETGESPFLPADVLLLCSDGLTDMIASRGIADILVTDKSLEHKARALVAAANEAGGKDNITVVLVQNPGEKPHSAPLITENGNAAIPASFSAPGPTEPLAAESPQERQTRSYKNGMLAFAVLALLLAGVLAWTWLQRPAEATPGPATAPATAPVRDSSEQQLQDSLISAGSRQLVLGGHPITLNDTLLINRDSLHVIGNGTLLRADSNYIGAALRLAPQVRYLLLENLTFENFETAIMAPANSVHVRNVRFLNCRTAVLANISAPGGQPLSGSPLNWTATTDSLKPKN